jgi:hypothetical protein
MAIESPFGTLVPGGGGFGKIFEPALKHRFRIEFNSMGTLGSGLWDGASGCDWAVRTFNPGGSQIEAGTIQVLNQQIRYPKNLSPGDAAELELIMFNPSTALDVMWKWHMSVGQRSMQSGGSIGLLQGAGGIGGSATVFALGPDGVTVIGGWHLANIWPCSIIAGTFDQSSESELLVHRVRFEVNQCMLIGSDGVTV